jgi:hypothetical protein
MAIAALYSLSAFHGGGRADLLQLLGERGGSKVQ